MLARVGFFVFGVLMIFGSFLCASQIFTDPSPWAACLWFAAGVVLAGGGQACIKASR